MNQLKYERIDKGQKRAKRIGSSKHRPTEFSNSGALANIDDQAILGRIKAGEYSSRIAAELGVDKSALSHRYKDHPGYAQAKEDGTEARLEQAEIEIQEARTSLNLARGRERFRAVAWRAEREFSHRWGQKQEVTHRGNVGPLINIQISGDPLPVVVDTVPASQQTPSVLPITDRSSHDPK